MYLRSRSTTTVSIAVLAALAALATACGDGTSGPVAPAPAGSAAATAQPAAPKPFALTAPADAALDDETVLAALIASAATGAPLPSALDRLPPRVSPVRVAVRAMHDHLVGATGAAPDWDKLIAAIERLAQGDRTKVDGGALASLVKAWKAWTPEERAAEGAFAEYYARRIDLMRTSAPVDPKAVAAEPKLPMPPAMSPAFAVATEVRAGLVAVTAPGEDIPPALRAALEVATKSFTELGWPGGAGPVLDVVVAKLENGRKPTMRSLVLGDKAFEAYRQSGDSLRAALITYERSATAERQGDTARALQLARVAVEQIDATATRGRELSDALFRRAQLAIALGKPDDAATSLDRALAEISYAKLDPVQRAPIGELAGTALWFLGRFDDSARAADDGAAAFDEAFAEGNAAPSPEQLLRRATLDEVAARALVDAGRLDDGAARFIAAADRHAKLPGGDRPATTARLFAADALARAGKKADARAIVDSVLARGELSATVVAHAASVLRTAGVPGEAARLLSDIEKAATPALHEALVEEWARTVAAQGDTDRARSLFASAARSATKAAGTQPAGFAAARVFIDWAKLERDAGDPEEASRIADQAIFHLTDGPYVVELDRARKLWADLQRRRGYFIDAERVAADRVKAGPPGAQAQRDDAALDLFLIRWELASAQPNRSREALPDVAGRIPDAATRDVAVAVAKGETPSVGTLAAGSRARRLAETVALAAAAPGDVLASVRGLLRDEPEMARVALRRLAERPEGARAGLDWTAWLDLWCGAEATSTKELTLALEGGDRFLGVAPMGRKTVIVHARAGELQGFVVDGDVGVTRFWEAVHNEPSAARLRSDGDVFTNTNETLRALLGADPEERLIICIGPPYGGFPMDMTGLGPQLSRRQLIDVRDIGFAASPAEIVAAARRPKPSALSFSRSPEAPLRDRNAIVTVVPVDDTTRGRFATLVEEARRRGVETSAAVREAKKRMREEYEPDPRHPGVPAWAAFVLRGLR
ncbi:MAG: hypothetical protein K8T90_05810 [Planctomycetes bacterium]|nr:hypothetical protein [Planctomycetota bacterium]